MQSWIWLKASTRSPHTTIMTLKAFVRDLTPPALWRVIQSSKGRYKMYPSRDAAAAAAGNYDDNILNRFRAARAKTAPPTPLQDNALIWLVRILPGPLSVVDFGGATGGVGLALREHAPDLKFTVVETPALVALMQETGDIAFTTSMPATCDVFYSSGTLQYVPDPYAVLEQAFAAARQAVVLKRNYFSERPIIRVHHSRLFENGAGPIPDGYQDVIASYPSATVQETRVHEIAARHGFVLFTRAPEFDGVTIPDEGAYGAQLVFLRK
jgi:putative methyltransferase (TIGR04325 family)